MQDAKPKPDMRRIHRVLLDRWGPQHWWPAETGFEVAVGSILTQNTAWTNVEKAVVSLRAAGLLDPHRMIRTETGKLAEYIRSSGTFRVKARRLKAFCEWFIGRFDGDIGAMAGETTPRLRRELLAIPGIGPETADCILLYAAGRDVFVVDAYTRRVLERHGWYDHRAPYDAIAGWFSRFWADETEAERARIFNELHALIVRLAKEYCRSRPLCRECPLKPWLPDETDTPPSPRPPPSC